MGRWHRTPAALCEARRVVRHLDAVERKGAQSVGICARWNGFGQPTKHETSESKIHTTKRGTSSTSLYAHCVENRTATSGVSDSFLPEPKKSMHALPLVFVQFPIVMSPQRRPAELTPQYFLMYHFPASRVGLSVGTWMLFGHTGAACAESSSANRPARTHRRMAARCGKRKQTRTNPSEVRGKSRVSLLNLPSPRSSTTAAAISSPSWRTPPRGCRSPMRRTVGAQ